MQKFGLEDGYDFIELNKLLKVTQLAGSGGEANQLIIEGHVEVNGFHTTQKRRKLRKGDVVEMDGEMIKIV